jgi:SAM-dependent methyltransferase/tetratricopeptide (TPR) repeat protein
MTNNPRVDVVAQQYQNWQYPEPIHDLEAWLVNNWQWYDPQHAHRLFWPDHDYRAGLDILIAGCGTNQAAVIAFTNPSAKVVAIDVSQPSLNHHRLLKDKYRLDNLELHCLPIEEVATLNRSFDLVISTGVLHHLADPKVGLKALAEKLRPNGVAAIMVYASYGRVGVEMLKGVFQDMGLRQDEASLAVLKSAIRGLPSDHPVQSYMAMAPDLQFDAGLVDTFLHGRDRNFTVADCLDLVDASGLVFQDWLLKSPYYPDPARDDPFLAALADLPVDRQWAVMERINHRNGCHFFIACRPDRPTSTYRIDFTNDQWLDLIPEFRYRCALDGAQFSRPGWTITLPPGEAGLARLIDGRRSIGQIVVAVAGEGDLGDPMGTQPEAMARSMFRRLWQGDFLAMRLAPRLGEYARDPEILQAEVDRDPSNARAVYYLAQSYRDAQNFAQARKWFERRAEMGGWDEEVYSALFEAARAMNSLGLPWPEVQDAFLRAWEYRPTRAEPLHAIASRSRQDGRYLVGLLFAQQASRIPLPDADTLFVDTSVYAWRAVDELAVCASWLGLWDQTLQHCEHILARNDLPPADRQRIETNRDRAQHHFANASPQGGAAGHALLKPALLRRLLRRAVANGQIRLPAVPAMLDDYQALCDRTFAALGVEFSADQQAQLCAVLKGQLQAAWAASPRSEIVIHYETTTGLNVKYEVKAQWASLGAAYDNWVSTREPPYFGSLPDARVWALASDVAVPQACPVLDVGAGTGRNALALARRGHPVDALELSTQFATILRAEAAKQALPVRVIERDAFSSGDDLRTDYGLIIASEVTPDFRATTQLRQLFELAATHLAVDGQLVLNVFLARPGYEPDAAARELGQQVYSCLYTRAELQAAAARLPLELVTDDLVFDYEQAHLPPGGWPPTGWYAGWVSGLDLFDVDPANSPVGLRWLVYRRLALP